MRAVEGSFKAAKDGVTSLITGLVTKNVRIKAADESSLSSMRLISQSSNIYMDDEKHMWQFRKSAAGGILVQTLSDDDMESMNRSLSSMCQTATRKDELALISQCSAAELLVDEGDYVSFIDDNAQRRFGMTIATVIEEDGEDTGKVLVDAGGQTPEVVDKAAIVASVNCSKLTANLTTEEQVNRSVAAARGEHKLQDLVNYYRKIYGHNAEFFAQFKSRLESHQFFRPL